jgi:septum formation topological specificity factor MinE
MDAKLLLDLKRRRDDAAHMQSRLEGAAKTARARFEEVVAEVRAAGLDPKTLQQSLEQKEAELLAATAKFESDLAAAETALAGFSEVQ